MRVYAVRLQLVTVMATVMISVLVFWSMWEAAAGPMHMGYRRDGQLVSGIVEYVLGQAMPQLSLVAERSFDPATAIDGMLRSVLGAGFSEHEQMLKLAVPGISIMEVVRQPEMPVIVATPDEEPEVIDDTEKEQPDEVIKDDATEPIVLVYHAHAREAFMKQEIETGQVRFHDSHSDDPAITVLSVGEVLMNNLLDLGVPAIQSRVVHDRDGRLGAYREAQKTLERKLVQYPELLVLLDVHRDAQRRPLTTVEVNGVTLARVLLVLGQDNDDWKQNYQFGARFLYRLNEYAPGISRGILPKDSRYNQHMSPGALLVEIGGPENTMDEAFRTAELIAQVVADMWEAGELPPYGDESH